MTFLNVALAVGAIACVIPIVIHLLNRRRFDVVRWGAMHLIAPVVRTNRKRIRLEQLLLLLMRMAILALLALCMAGPVLTGWNALAGNAKTSLALLFDNSYSMDAGTDAATNLEIAKRNAAQIVEFGRRGSDVSVSLMAGGEITGSTSPTTNRKQTAKEISELPSGFGAAQVTESFEHATRSLGKMQHAKRDLVIVSDFQKDDWSGESASALQQATDMIDAMPIKPTVTLMQVGTEGSDNVSIQSLDISPRVVAVDQGVSIRVNLRNHSQVPFPGIRVNLQVDGSDKESETLDLGSGEDGQLLFRHQFTDPGSHVIKVQADADSLRSDNSYLAVVPVWDRLPVLLVDGDPHQETLKSETGFLQLALSPFITAAGSGSDQYDSLPRADLLEALTATQQQLSPQRLQQSRVLVLANVARLSDQQLSDVKQYVRRGGSLLVFAGDRMDLDWYQENVFSTEDGLIPLSLASLESQEIGAAAANRGLIRQVSSKPGLSGQNEAGVTIAKTHMDHPALELFNDSRNGHLSDATLNTWYKLNVTGDCHVVARLTSGDPLLVENSFGDGRVIVCATTCDAAWNNLPSRPFYLPLMQRLVTYLATAVEPRRNVSVGQTLVAQIGSDAENVTITRPDGTHIEVTPQDRARRGMVEYADTSQQGLYTVQVASLPAMHYAVVAPREESELKLLDDEQMKTLAESLDASVVQSADQYIEQDSRRRYGREIWRPMYWLMLCLVLGEVVMQQVFSGMRFGGGKGVSVHLQDSA